MRHGDCEIHTGLLKAKKGGEKRLWELRAEEKAPGNQFLVTTAQIEAEMKRCETQDGFKVKSREPQGRFKP